MRALHQGTTIGSLRVRAAGRDAAALAARTEAVLRTLDIEPPGAPSSAILCIRALNDPMPGGIDVRSSHVRRAAAWEHAARGAMDAAYRRAVRPILGMVPAAADAVIFADRAELLACAARDAVRGLLASWWWAYLLRSATFDGVVQEWMHDATYVPAALDIVAEIAHRNDLVAFVGAIEPARALELLQRSLDAHDARPLANAMVRRFSVDTRRDERDEQPSSAVRPAWADVVPELDRQLPLTIEQQAFAGIVLALRRAPTLVRSGSFAEHCLAWIATGVHSQTGPPQIDGDEELRHPDWLRRIAATPPFQDGIVRGPVGRLPVEIPQRVGRTSDMHGASSDRRAGSARRDEAFSGSTSAETGSPQPWQITERARPTAVRALPPAPPFDRRIDDGHEHHFADATLLQAEPRVESHFAPRFDTSIVSGYAGVFFLLDVATAIGLYDPYGSERLALDVWDYLALAGRAFAPEIEGDPVWTLLAALANRTEGQPPGAGFVPPDQQPLQDWLSVLVKRIGEYLHAVMPVDDPGMFLVARIGRIDVTPAHVDVFFSLADHPIEIRLSGLDRDPGWIPAAGRHVDFHFE